MFFVVSYLIAFSQTLVAKSQKGKSRACETDTRFQIILLQEIEQEKVFFRVTSRASAHLFSSALEGYESAEMDLQVRLVREEVHYHSD
jgi:hypothetical protein